MVWRLVEWADTFTIRAHSAARRSGIAARTHRIMPMAPRSIVSLPLLVGELLEAADARRAGGVHEDVQGPPPLAHLGERRVHLAGVGDVHPDAERLRCTQLQQLLRGGVEVRRGPRHHRHPGAIGGEARRRRSSHALRAALHDRRCPCESEIHPVLLAFRPFHRERLDGRHCATEPERSGSTLRSPAVSDVQTAQARIEVVHELGAPLRIVFPGKGCVEFAFEGRDPSGRAGRGRRLR